MPVGENNATKANWTASSGRPLQTRRGQDWEPEPTPSSPKTTQSTTTRVPLARPPLLAKLRVSMTLQARTRLITFRLADLVNDFDRCGARTSARPPPCAAGCVKCIRARPRSERKATAASHRKIPAAHQSGGQDKCASSNSSSTDSCTLQFENESPMIRIIWLEVPNTKHYWVAATDDCDIGILLGLRQRVTATNAC